MRITVRDPVQDARRIFFENGREPRGLVPRDILASWRRCRQMGMAANHYYCATPVEQATLRVAQERYAALRQVCRPELAALYACADRADCIVILTAPDGFILDALGNPDFLGKAARVSLRPGVPWCESANGTNAVGTAIVERRPIEVRGAEHYYVPHRILSCSASPILDPHGAVLGVLDLSGEAALQHPLALGMVQLAVEQIEYRLFEREFPRADIVRVHADPTLLGTPREGMLAFRDDQLIAANRKALQLLGIEWGALGKLSASSLFEAGLPQPGSAAAGLRVRTGRTLYARRDAPRAGSSVPPRPSRGTATAAMPRRLPVILTAAQDAAISRCVRLLDADLPILLQGETGTGKEVVARELHRRSQRAAAAFVAVNCAALPEGLIESELFGYVRGAFTGARREGAPGRLRDADGGVLFLDEIGDMPQGLQCRLLRVLQEREVTPLGSSEAFPIDVAVIAATNRDIDAAVAAGVFRSDLYYRIAQSVLRLPPLREQPELATLIPKFWSALGADAVPLRLGPELVAALAARPWPGNVRQLLAVLRRLVALGEPGATLTCADLPGDLRAAKVPIPPAAGAPRDLRDIELDAIRAAIAANGGSVSAAARMLHISRSRVYRLLRGRPAAD